MTTESKPYPAAEGRTVPMEQALTRLSLGFFSGIGDNTPREAICTDYQPGNGTRYRVMLVRHPELLAALGERGDEPQAVLSVLGFGSCIVWPTIEAHDILRHFRTLAQADADVLIDLVRWFFDGKASQKIPSRAYRYIVMRDGVVQYESIELSTAKRLAGNLLEKGVPASQVRIFDLDAEGTGGQPREVLP